MRQVCPLSPYLFILAAEVLATKIRQDKTVRGITIFETESKISQFADDTSAFCDNLSSVQNLTRIHRMQIWRTTRSPPGTSCMKARLVRPLCFVLTMLPQKSLASLSICFYLFRFAYEFVVFSMPPEESEKYYTIPL